METPKKILVPTDFSRKADKTLNYALMLAEQFKAEINLVHIVTDLNPYAGDYSLTPAMVKEYRTKSLESAKEKISKVIEKKPEAKNVKITTEVRLGNPSQEILNDAEKKKVDLIVIATRGKSAIIHQVMGSVAERILRGAKCPIVLLRH